MKTIRLLYPEVFCCLAILLLSSTAFAGTTIEVVDHFNFKILQADGNSTGFQGNPNPSTFTTTQVPVGIAYVDRDGSLGNHDWIAFEQGNGTAGAGRVMAGRVGDNSSLTQLLGPGDIGATALSFPHPGGVGFKLASQTSGKVFYQDATNLHSFDVSISNIAMARTGSPAAGLLSGFAGIGIEGTLGLADIRILDIVYSPFDDLVYMTARKIVGGSTTSDGRLYSIAAGTVGGIATLVKSGITRVQGLGYGKDPGDPSIFVTSTPLGISAPDGTSGAGLIDKYDIDMATYVNFSTLDRVVDDAFTFMGTFATKFPASPSATSPSSLLKVAAGTNNYSTVASTLGELCRLDGGDSTVIPELPSGFLGIFVFVMFSIVLSMKKISSHC